jgi:hypothetical protein
MFSGMLRHGFFSSRHGLSKVWPYLCGTVSQTVCKSLLIVRGICEYIVSFTKRRRKKASGENLTLSCAGKNYKNRSLFPVLCLFCAAL